MVCKMLVGKLTTAYVEDCLSKKIMVPCNFLFDFPGLEKNTL